MRSCLLLVMLLAPAPGVGDPRTRYAALCTACHGFGIAGAPRLGDAPSWTPRIAKGREALYRNAIEGFTGQTGVMPPKGGFTDLTDREIRELVDFMVESIVASSR